jgi:hypothetical protein
MLAETTLPTRELPLSDLGQRYRVTSSGARFVPYLAKQMSAPQSMGRRHRE